jgi:hypothetical protein
MSDTPRTDAEAFWPHDSKEKVCDAVFARQLEGELNAANERIKQWHNALTPLMPSDFKCWHENTPNEWPEVAAWVITSQRERIKRIESWIESLEVLEQHSGILPEREWFGSEIGYLRKGEAVYKGEAKP